MATYDLACASSVAATALLARLIRFSLPGGVEAVRRVRIIRTQERGEIRSAPGARWIAFTANQRVETFRSAYRWEARLRTGPLRVLTVTDAYENGHGHATVKLGGVVPVATAARGAALDQGEMQRYLGLLACCPAALLNHRSLIWEAVGPGGLRVRDAADPLASTVDLEIGEDGRPLGVRAERPRMVGRTAISTPWSGRYAGFREWEGLRVPTEIQAVWHLPDGGFTYYRGATVSLSTS